MVFGAQQFFSTVPQRPVLVGGSRRKYPEPVGGSDRVARLAVAVAVAVAESTHKVCRYSSSGDRNTKREMK